MMVFLATDGTDGADYGQGILISAIRAIGGSTQEHYHPA